jgi:hypothetical protein
VTTKVDMMVLTKADMTVLSLDARWVASTVCKLDRKTAWS